MSEGTSSISVRLLDLFHATAALNMVVSRPTWLAPINGRSYIGELPQCFDPTTQTSGLLLTSGAAALLLMPICCTILINQAAQDDQGPPSRLSYPFRI